MLLDLSADGKTGSVRVAIWWPAGALAYDEPLRVVTADGQVSGRVGGPVDLAGGFIDPKQLPVLGCAEFTVACGRPSHRGGQSHARHFASATGSSPNRHPHISCP